MLCSYLDTYQSMSRDTSLVVFWRPRERVLALEEYHQKFWSVLRFLHERDPEHWPEDVPDDPDDPMWEFSFGGTSIFVVCNTPAHTVRHSRNSPGFVITFQPRWVFDGLAPETPRGTAARRVIRKRLRAFDGMEPSSALGNYGDPDNREWRQYFLPDRNSDPELGCPFRAGRPATAGGDPGVGDPAGGDDGREALRRRMLAEAGVPSAERREPAIAARAAGPDAPLSSAQHRMWVVQRLEPDSAAYNLCAALRLDGGLAVPALARALDAAVHRHEVLRTTYHERLDGTVRQRVRAAGGSLLRTVDLTARYAEEGEAAVDAVVAERGGRPFDLAEDLPLRAFLLRLTDSEHVLVLVLHHIACDDSTWSLLFADLAAAYRSELSGIPTDPGSGTRRATRPCPRCRCSTPTSRPGSGRGAPRGRSPRTWRTGATSSPRGRCRCPCRPTGPAPSGPTTPARCCAASCTRPSPSGCAPSAGGTASPRS
ncbi:MAG TPA: YqcI/YcgG family protein [Pseudonocardia sp.]|jgi:hypothetical protein